MAETGVRYMISVKHCDNAGYLEIIIFVMSKGLLRSARKVMGLIKFSASSAISVLISLQNRATNAL